MPDLTLAEQIAALGPRPMVRPGVYSREAADYDKKYRLLFPATPLPPPREYAHRRPMFTFAAKPLEPLPADTEPTGPTE